MIDHSRTPVVAFQIMQWALWQSWWRSSALLGRSDWELLITSLNVWLPVSTALRFRYFCLKKESNHFANTSDWACILWILRSRLKKLYNYWWTRWKILYIHVPHDFGDPLTFPLGHNEADMALSDISQQILDALSGGIVGKLLTFHLVPSVFQLF